MSLWANHEGLAVVAPLENPFDPEWDVTRDEVYEKMKRTIDEHQVRWLHLAHHPGVWSAHRGFGSTERHPIFGDWVDAEQLSSQEKVTRDRAELELERWLSLARIVVE